MSSENETDYGPLTDLIGRWKGDRGTDIAPEPDGEENNPYYETIVFSAVGDVDNAESQQLAAVHYHQIVRRKSNDEVFHDETGYWMWDAAAGIIMHSLAIPRAVSLLAGGSHTGKRNESGEFVLDVSAALDDENWPIIQSPFMQKNARTTKFSHRITTKENHLSYSETTIVEIYDRVFEHTDHNALQRQ